MPPPKRTKNALQQAKEDQEARTARTDADKARFQLNFEAVFGTPQGMQVYDWLMNLCGLYSSNQNQNSNVYRQEAQRDIANQIRKVSSNLHIKWLQMKAKNEN